MLRWTQCASAEDAVAQTNTETSTASATDTSGSPLPGGGGAPGSSQPSSASRFGHSACCIARGASDWVAELVVVIGGTADGKLRGDVVVLQVDDESWFRPCSMEGAGASSIDFPAAADGAGSPALRPAAPAGEDAGAASAKPGPGARSFHAASAVGHCIFLYGGCSGSKRCLDDMWRLDVNTWEWELLATEHGPGEPAVGPGGRELEIGRAHV